MFTKYIIFYCIVIFSVIHNSVLGKNVQGVGKGSKEFNDCLHSMAAHFGKKFNKRNSDVTEIATIWCKRQESHESLNKRTVWDNKYDYIVVGGGTAGIIVAVRLAEDSSKKILLIEAGGPTSVESDIPAFKEKLGGGDLDWNYQIKPQEYAYLGIVGNQYNISRAKAFGGCSMHNDMNYYRENPEYFDYLTKLTGVKGWTWSEVLPYFKKSENNLDDKLVKNYPKDHVKGGPISISSIPPDPILQFYMKKAPALGYPNTYTDGRQPFGSTIPQKNIKNGIRQSTGLVFLENNQKTNLHILGKTLVTKILFNEEKRAIGVQFYRNKKKSDVFATKEVIISAGSVGSPHLLMLSGIGPKEHLSKLKIPIISNLNVGKLLYDLSVTIYFDIKNQSLIEKPIENYDNYKKYLIEKKGPLAYSDSAITCFREVQHREYPNLSNGVVLNRVGFIGTDLEDMVKKFKLKDEWKEYYRPYLNRSVFKLIPVLRRPYGKAVLRLKSKDPFVPPLIEPCYFCDQQDYDDFIKVFNKTMDIFLSPAMSKVVERFKSPIPGCEPCPNHYYCESYVKCYIQKHTDSVYPNGGCPMGGANDGKSVVDQKLRVFGVSGLRVIDSSVMPVQTEQSMAITIMIGEYGSDLIKKDVKGETKTSQTTPKPKFLRRPEPPRRPELLDRETLMTD